MPTRAPAGPEGRPGEDMDRLLVSALMRCGRANGSRCSPASTDAELANFYETLFTSEFGHYRVFLELARKMMVAPAVEARWQQLLAVEAGFWRAGDRSANPLRLIRSGCARPGEQFATLVQLRSLAAMTISPPSAR